jgi:TRAP-type C4-dicarboxylate transport system permease small subunit
MKSSPRIRRAATTVYSFFLGWLTLEILFRRWVWNQVPTQVSGAWVYATILLNGGVLTWLVLRPGSRARLTKTGKS